MLLQRGLVDAVSRALSDRPVVVLQGARQTGKSTLAQMLVERQGKSGSYLTLDHAATLATASRDPDGFIAGLGPAGPDGGTGTVVLDEVQLAPGLFRAIKAAVDRHRVPGRFLLTGSANILLVPKISESLAGRAEIHTLWPLSQGEAAGRRETLIDALFDAGFHWPSVTAESWPDLAARIVRGGYPEAMTLTDESRRQAWFASYLTAILQRDVRDMAHISGLADLPRLLSLLASRVTALQNFADIARGLSMPQTTLKRYMALLEAAFLIRLAPAWSSQLGQRLVKAPKILFTDSGFLCHLLGADVSRLRSDDLLAARVLENFVAMELIKQASWRATQPAILHFRTPPGHEVDLVLESRAGTIVGVDVRASATLGPDDWRGMRTLADIAGPRFARGVIFYTGRDIVPAGANLHAVPAAALWNT